ncbi:hypothetical protein SAMN05216556_13821 [Aequorivita viscosa]|uniref:Lipoprotein n=1 Tax=Aequorivita viscosa TaxID=797419 RepID=A0A1M6MKI0_9FLAO|nr:hypothetical protein SAMN05216556_13821 [Aequorivita viscosa]SHJ83924.1 hypothetical protein SAMN04487908_1281 [Aequorivita viscosa]
MQTVVHKLKKIVTKYKILILIGLLVSCITEKTEYGNAELSQKINLTEISSVFKNSTEFNNDTLKISGVLHLDLENKGIYAKSDKIWLNSFKPATELDSVWKRMNGKKVELIGLYKSGKTGHLGLYNGQFTEIYYIKTK